ncbi:MAG: hypothetical protein HKN33_02960, partial [Pyrinomonadaceae bacterium]|nr:hypothetical protein [Pyrinomonadaceae bacterium]
GHELAVLEGAKEILETDRPILLFESGNLVNGDVVNGPVFRFLESMGFEGYFLNERRLVSVSDFDSEIHFIDQSAYQNFVFVHPTALNWESKVRPYKVNRSEITSTGFQGDSRAVN